MRIALNVVGVLLLLLGSVWILQGMNVLAGAGIVGLLYANRKRKSAV
jgi:hypothetical protein